MTPWQWWAGDLDTETYDLACGEPSKEAAIRAAMRQLQPGDRFRIVEARMSEDRRYEGSDFVPLLRERHHEVCVVGPRAREQAATA